MIEAFKRMKRCSDGLDRFPGLKGLAGAEDRSLAARRPPPTASTFAATPPQWGVIGISWERGRLARILSLPTLSARLRAQGANREHGLHLATVNSANVHCASFNRR